MNNINLLTRKRLLIAFLILGVILITLLALNRGKPKSVKFILSPVLGQNIQFPHYINSNSVRFFTGSAFAEFDLNTNTSKGLTREIELPNVTDIKWNGQLVLFKVAKLTDSDELARQAGGSQNVGSHYWWLINLDTGLITPVVSSVPGYDVVDLAWKNNSTNYYALLQKQLNDQLITVQSLDGKSQSETTKTNDLILIGDTAKGLLLQQFTSSYVFNNRKLDKLAFKTSRKPLIVDGGSAVVYEELVAGSERNTSEAKRGAIKYFDLENSKNSTLSKDNSGNYAVGNNMLLSLPAPPAQGNQSATKTNVKEITGIVAETKGKVKFTPLLPDSSSLELGILSSVHELEAGKKYILVNAQRQLFVLGTDPTVAKLIGKNPLLYYKSAPGPLNGTKLSYDGVRNELDIYYVAGGDGNKERQAVMTLLSGQGKDPNQVKKSWHKAEALSPVGLDDIGD